MTQLCDQPSVSLVTLEILLSLSDGGLLRSAFGPGCLPAPAGANATTAQLCGALGDAAAACQAAGKKVFLGLLAKREGAGFVDSAGRAMFGNASEAGFLAGRFRAGVSGPLFGGRFVPDGVSLEVIPDTGAPFRRRSVSPPPPQPPPPRSGGGASPLAVFLGVLRDLMRASSPAFEIAVSLPCEDPYVLPAGVMDAVDLVTVRFNDPACNLAAFSLGGFFSTWRGQRSTMASSSSATQSETRSHGETHGVRVPSMQVDVPSGTGSPLDLTTTTTSTSTRTITRTAFVTGYPPDPPSPPSDDREVAPPSSSSSTTSTEILIVSVISSPSSSSSAGAAAAAPSIAIPSVLPNGLGEAEFVSAISSFLAAQSRSALPSMAPVIEIPGVGPFTVNLVRRTVSPSPTHLPDRSFRRITILSAPTSPPVPDGSHTHSHRGANRTSVSPLTAQGSGGGDNHARQPRVLIGFPGAQATNASALPALVAELRTLAAEAGFGGVAVLGSFPAMEASGAWGALVGVFAAVFGQA
jgi:hypothetical protein